MQSNSLLSVLLDIANAVNSTEDLQALFQKIHHSLKNFIDVPNFYIALYDAKEDMVSFPYWVDEYNPKRPNNIYFYSEKADSITNLVIQSGSPLIYSRDQLIAFWDQQNCPYQEPICESWLGVPLTIKGEVFGVMVVQDYAHANSFSENEIILLTSIAEQIANAINRKKRLKRYQNLVENIRDVFYTTNTSGRITYVSPSVQSVIESPAEAILDTYRWESPMHSPANLNPFICSTQRETTSETIHQSLKQRMPFSLEYQVVTKAGKRKWVRDQGQFFKDETNHWYLEGLISDIHGVKQTEQLNNTRYNISNAANTHNELQKLFQSIHISLKAIIKAEFFGIALYDAKKDLLSLVESAPERRNEQPAEIPKASHSTSLNMEVIRRQTPMVFSRQSMIEFAQKRGGKVLGALSEFWLGIPLMVKGEIIGSMFIENDDPNSPYTQDDIDNLLAVSDQIALVVERIKSAQELTFRERLITTLYKITNAMYTTTSLYQLYESIHHALAPIMNVENFTIALYDKSTDTLEFHYSADHVDPTIMEEVPNVSQTNSLTYYTIKNGTSLLLNLDDKNQLQKKLGGEMIGSVVSKCWLGIPLKGKSEILGAIINQDYENENAFKKEDIALLESISEQVAFAIEYKKARQDLASAQNELLEKARKAGMADIASDTIHNLGNILNSVKTSNHLIRDHLRHSSINGLKKAADLLKENMDRLEEFIGKDPSGKKLMQYFISVQESLFQELSQVTQLSQSLSGKIELMANVIMTQHNYIYEGPIEEESAIDEILGEILDLYEDTLKQMGIDLVREFSQIPKVLVQKTKLTHIVMNLIENTKDALRSDKLTEKKFTVTLAQDATHISITFKDSGEGIAPENLSRVFSHGFTTKSHGHGFGLHNCANLAADMKGTLWAESEGLGKGAAFILKLPKR